MRLVLISLMAACSWAQPSVEIRSVTGRASDRLKEAERHLQRAQQMATRDIKAPEERAVVDSDVAVFGAYFRPSIGSEPRIATLTEDGKDILVARWTVSGDHSAFSELTLWDTAESASFIFRLPRGSWSNEAAIRSTFERLLLPARADGRMPLVKSIALEISRDPQTQQWIGSGGFLVNLMPRQFDAGPPNWLDFWDTPSASYLSATFNVPWLDGPLNMRLVAERFPPLESRVGQWSKKRLLDELGTRGSEERDNILARELVKRDLTEDELLPVLQSRLRYENGALLQAVVLAGQAPRLAGAIRKYLQVDRWGNTKSLSPHPFQIVSRAEGVNFTDAALDVLRQYPGAYTAFFYAAEHGTTAADYRVLQELPRPNDAFGRACDRALQEMRKRLGLDDDGNPIAAR
jgi:hypothetical protein